MLRRVLLLAFLLLLDASHGAHGESQGTIHLPDGFVHQPIASGVENPTAFAFLPDGRVLVTEQKQAPPNDGQGFVYVIVGSTVVGPILTLPGVETAGVERGLLGVAIDHEWPARPHVYLHFTSPQSTNVIRRYTASGDLDTPGSESLSLSEPYDVLTDLPSSIEFHNGGTVRFGPDGMLYVSHGDDATDTCSELQDPSIWKGVILRLDVSGLPPGGGGPPPKADLVPAGNPFSGPTDNARLTYAVGLRNPFRFTVDPVTGALYAGDVGENGWEELDEVNGGENFGWPLREGAHDFPPGAGCGAAGEDPIAEYGRVEPGPAAIIAGPRYRNAGGPFAFGPSYDGDVFFVAFYRGFVRRLHLDGTWSPADPVSGQPNATDWATGLDFVSDLQQGPDGAIYYVRRFAEHFFGRIARVPTVAVGTDTGAPTALGLRVAPVPVPHGASATVSFTSSGTGVVDVGLFDVGGRRVGDVFTGLRGAGRHDIVWRAAAIEPGVYFVRVETEESVEVVRLPITR